MITLMSFGYNKGMPASFDVMFDARGIINPAKGGHYSHTDGRDHDLQMEVIRDPKAKAIVRAVIGLAKKSPNARIAIGCRYGKHRSVAIVERIAVGMPAFSDIYDNKLSCEVYHLDLEDEYPSADELASGSEVRSSLDNETAEEAHEKVLASLQ